MANAMLSFQNSVKLPIFLQRQTAINTKAALEILQEHEGVASDLPFRPKG